MFRFGHPSPNPHCPRVALSDEHRRFARRARARVPVARSRITANHEGVVADLIGPFLPHPPPRPWKFIPQDVWHPFSTPGPLFFSSNLHPSFVGSAVRISLRIGRGLDSRQSKLECSGKLGYV